MQSNPDYQNSMPGTTQVLSMLVCPETYLSPSSRGREASVRNKFCHTASIDFKIGNL